MTAEDSRWQLMSAAARLTHQPLQEAGQLGQGRQTAQQQPHHPREAAAAHRHTLLTPDCGGEGGRARGAALSLL
jgi:hypothetical protein